MSQNRSSAVMQQRKEAQDSLDDFPTPSWGTRALCTHVLSEYVHKLHDRSVWEPACNRGFMARPLGEFFRSVYATDVHDYGYPGMARVDDFLFPGAAPPHPIDWVITNPPFRLAEAFIEKGLAVAQIGVAVLVRISFLESEGRYYRLFSNRPPTYVAVFSGRLPIVRGRVDEEASSATSYSWLVWVHGEYPQPTIWIPPCRPALDRPGDYALPTEPDSLHP